MGLYVQQSRQRRNADVEIWRIETSSSSNSTSSESLNKA